MLCAVKQDTLHGLVTLTTDSSLSKAKDKIKSHIIHENKFQASK